MQKSNLKCIDARHLVHLAVGDDTLPDEEQQLVDHLHTCSDCRAYHAGMMDAMHALEQVRDGDCEEVPGKSIWPGLSAQLKSRQAAVAAGPEPRRFNVAVATLCACSLMLALVTAVQNLPSNNVDQYANQPVMQAVNVGFNANDFRNNTNPAAGQLIYRRQPNGTIVVVDRATGQVYAPNVTFSNDDGLNF
jgi:hypothetical protein